MKLTWQIRNFEQLDTRSFHDLIQLRIAVFVVEQDCPYQELDGFDQQAWHLSGTSESGEMLVCARVLPQGTAYANYPSIGRVIVSSSLRGSGVGHEVIKRSIDLLEDKYGKTEIKISAQKHLEKLYNKHGFLQSGDEYLEDGIPHIPMIRPASGT